jgi:hypothetical protein
MIKDEFSPLTLENTSGKIKEAKNKEPRRIQIIPSLKYLTHFEAVVMVAGIV